MYYNITKFIYLNIGFSQLSYINCWQYKSSYRRANVMLMRFIHSDRVSAKS